MRGFVMAAAAAVGLTAAAGQAEAAVYRFDLNGLGTYYDGAIFIIPVGGSITIDEALYPGGSIANTTMTLTAVYGSQYNPSDEQNTAVIETPEKTFSYSFASKVTTIDWSIAGVTSYNFSALLEPVAYSSSLMVKFDDVGQVIAWGGNETTGGSGDYGFGGPDGWDEIIEYVSQYQDLTERERQVGGWTRTTIVADPSPVPLPAAAPMLLTGTMALFALKRKKSKRSQF